MSSPLTGLGLSIRRQLKHQESPVTLHNAIKLECLSRTRITMEIREEPKLRRIVGHLAVYQKATEHILVTKMHQERVRRFEEQFKYADGDLWPEFSCPRKAPKPPPTSSPYSGAVVKNKVNHVVPISCETDQVEMPVQHSHVQGQHVPTNYIQVINGTTHEAFTVPIQAECVYGVVNLHQEQGLVLSPVKIQVPCHMSSSAAAQFWHILIQSLAKFCNRKGRLQPNYDMRQLEAYGIYPQMIAGPQNVCTEQYYWSDNSVQLVV